MAKGREHMGKCEYLTCAGNVVGNNRWASISVIEMLAHLFALGTICECYRTFLMKASKHFTTVSGIWSSLMLRETCFAYLEIGHWDTITLLF